MEKSDFDKLLGRYMSGDISPEEKQKMDRWLEINKTDQSDLGKLTREDERKIFSRITRAIGDEEVKIPRRERVSTLFVSRSLGIAATVILLVSAFFFVWMRNSAASDVTKMILNDGTIVWLRGDSKLNYYEKKDVSARFAELEGEALFEVAKDARRPFFIACGEVTVKVLGTSFNLRTTDQGVELDVLTGLVNLSSSRDSIGLNVRPNNRVIYSPEKVLESSLTKEEVSEVVRHTEYDMKFENVTMKEILEKVSEKFNVDVALGNDAIMNCKITGDFTDHSLQSTLMIVSEVLNLTYEVKGNAVTINGRGCQ